MDPLPDGLSEQQRRFVDEFLIDLDKQAAAERAGYTSAGSGARLHALPYVRAAIDKAIRARRARSLVEQDQVIGELTKLAFSDMRSVLTWGERDSEMVEEEVPVPEAAEPGEPVPTVKILVQRRYGFVHLRDVDEIDDDIAAAISEISQTKDGVKVKLHDKKGALVDLGRHLGLFKDNLLIGGGAKPVELTAKLDLETFKAAARELLKNV